MSNQTNDRIAERLFERLENYQSFMTMPDYAAVQSSVLRLISRGEWQAAAEVVDEVERTHPLKLPHNRWSKEELYDEIF